ncbi:cysteinyl-tRNA synthetase [Monoraphidium neglectum]|uniref:cysteine--tRNA ligase n=1 Tax=Monoraphidium neglectum TaxID=145388 RepID=A0A0D2KMW4_9CHLO|nr:cysteinyl-tRNA synthetase [Monoraphidium neglectum]KIY97033.1 cysteinyl-tRNA synthetase [Monoraphidium neglectum]|eukprot:XP_013896053.1 cysteinyl-tRNA synthetase [Monoraphidium neglectum]
MRLIQGRVPLAVAARPAVTSVPPVLLRRQARCVASEPAGLCRALSSSSTSSSGSMPAARWPLPRCSLPPAAAACSSAAAAPRRRPRAGAAPAQAEAAVAAAGASLEELRGALQLYNTMARTKQGLRPREGMGDKLQMYVCGVTVYDYSHIGHARVYVAFDVLYRMLSQLLRYDVQYVRNFTDVDDKIINRANEAGEDPLALSARFIDEFHTDMRLLGCLSPTDEPKATEYIPQMVETIQRIIDNGHAYAVEGGDVFFDVASLPGYGRLSGRQQEDNRAGERVAVDGRKRSPADFALWKSVKPGEPSWESPWGAGRPGWHIECSAMIRSVLGPVIDVHGGGRDLVFPHHENELAQSQAAAGCCDKPHLHEGTDFVRLWMHNGFVNVDSEKMSKSLGNFFTIREVLKSYHPLALRWFLVATHYRAPVNYTQRALEEASDRAYYVFQTLADAAAALEAAGDAGAAAAAQAEADAREGRGEGAALAQAVRESLLDDLNTPAVVGALSAPLKAVNDLLTTKAGRKNPNR